MFVTCWGDDPSTQDYTPLAEKCKEQGVLLILCTSEVVSLGLLKNAGEMGADIFVAEGQVWQVILHPCACMVGVLPAWGFMAVLLTTNPLVF